MKRYKIQEVCQIVGVEDNVIHGFVRNEWIDPASRNADQFDSFEFDDEDLTRIRLILELMNDLDVNAEGIPIVLHLVDQIHHLRINFQKSPRG